MTAKTKTASKSPSRGAPVTTGRKQVRRPGDNTPRKQGRTKTATTVPEQLPAAVNTAGKQQAVPAVAATGKPAPIKTVRQPGRNPNELIVERDGVETMEETDARTAMDPAMAHSFLVRAFASQGMFKGHTLDATMAHDVIAAKIEAVSGGDLKDIEAPLVATIYSLQAMGTEYTRRASLCLNSPEVSEIYMRLGLRCFSQMRAHAEAVAEIKNPRPVFAKQTNIANGPQQVNNAQQQQVNNGAGSPGAPRTEETEPTTIKLLAAE